MCNVLIAPNRIPLGKASTSFDVNFSYCLVLYIINQNLLLVSIQSVIINTHYVVVDFLLFL